jgi:hypothetical protein
MAKKNAPPKPLRPAPAAPLLSRRGKVVIGAGILVVAIGFYVLSLTDPAGRNWASHLCPFLILGGYALIGVGIMLPDPEPKPAQPSSPPSLAGR